jgi:hypothetical protein
MQPVQLVAGRAPLGKRLQSETREAASSGRAQSQPMAFQSASSGSNPSVSMKWRSTTKK